ncbi:MAG: S-methyl-5-thioribose-1-phosphate isomerase, partial [Deltaproteobacteria bacterium]|nr:S-methyl-5-thioribose-1-phosphate isomerase [Deltaproteobacteria bacterium]
MSLPVLPSLSRAPLTESSAFFAVELEPEGEGGPEVVMLEQRALPSRVEYVRLRKVDEVARAIRDMVVRGAPAIGIAAAYGLVLQAYVEKGDATTFLLAMGIAGRGLGATRPTAVNLGWAIARMS